VVSSKSWVPDRRDVIWIDYSPHAGGEMRDCHPFLVLSPAEFNARTALVIGLPMTTAEYNATNPFAVPAGSAGGKNKGKNSYVLCHQPKSFDWRVRNAAPHPAQQLAPEFFDEVCAVLNQIVQLA
jgi:mRNA interferase MazF